MHILNHRRKLAWLLLPLVILLISCGAEKVPEIELPNIGVTESVIESTTPEQNTLAEYPISDTLMTITWENFSPQPNQMMKLPDDGKIAAVLNERFNVIMSSQLMTDWNWTEVLQKQREEGTLPDIFSPYFNESYDEAFKAGGMRTIPWAMIEQYAPRYAALFGDADVSKYDWYKSSDNEFYVLLGLEKEVGMLSTYSVYRLDWLEELGITPHGNVTELSDRLFFTESAFTMEEFVNIMQAFTTTENGGRYGLSAGSPYDRGIVDGLMGMFGVNWSYIRENGQAVMYEASDGFRSFLQFMEMLNGLEVIHVTEDTWSGRYNNKIGWWGDSVRNIFGDYGYAKNFLTYQTDMKLLITPPEIGLSGMQGADTYAKEGDITISSAYMISDKVSDEKLAKILQIFDAVSYDPELYVLTKYGVEGDDFTWTGEPYNSPVAVNKSSTEYTGLFNTRTLDGNAGKYIYNFPSEAMYQYATSAEARRMNIPPYKSDPEGIYEDDMQALYEKYQSNLYDIASTYYQDILKGDKRVDSSWDDYVAELKAAGLDEWNELINKFPVTN